MDLIGALEKGARISYFGRWITKSYNQQFEVWQRPKYKAIIIGEYDNLNDALEELMKDD